MQDNGSLREVPIDVNADAQLDIVTASVTITAATNVAPSYERDRPVRTQASPGSPRGTDSRGAARCETLPHGRVHKRCPPLRRRRLPEDRPATRLPHHEPGGRSSRAAGQRAQLPQEPAVRQAAGIARKRPPDE